MTLSLTAAEPALRVYVAAANGALYQVCGPTELPEWMRANHLHVGQRARPLARGRVRSARFGAHVNRRGGGVLCLRSRVRCGALQVSVRTDRYAAMALSVYGRSTSPNSTCRHSSRPARAHLGWPLRPAAFALPRAAATAALACSTSLRPSTPHWSVRTWTWFWTWPWIPARESYSSCGRAACLTSPARSTAQGTSLPPCPPTALFASGALPSPHRQFARRFPSLWHMLQESSLDGADVRIPVAQRARALCVLRSGPGDGASLHRVLVTRAPRSTASCAVLIAAASACATSPTHPLVCGASAANWRDVKRAPARVVASQCKHACPVDDVVFTPSGSLLLSR
jgi:hypothetical protein